MPEPNDPDPELPQEPRRTPVDWAKWMLAISSVAEALTDLYRTFGK